MSWMPSVEVKGMPVAGSFTVNDFKVLACQTTAILPSAKVTEL